ncbi:MAG: hypothetical protein QM778_11925 [Myxococcales bacterium]
MSVAVRSGELGEHPTLPPGEGPFRIKGTGYLGHMRWVEQHYPGGRQAFLAAVSPSIRAFLDQPFLAMSLFDIMPLICAGHTCARVCKTTFFQFIANRSGHQAQQDLTTLHRALLKLASPRMVASRVPMLMSQYFDFGETAVLESDAKSVRFELSSIPVMYAEWLHAVYDGFGRTLVEATGGVSPRLSVERVPLGNVRSFPACKLRGTMSWQ